MTGNIFSPEALSPVDPKEVLRYAGAREDGEYAPLLAECIALADGHLSYRLAYGVFPVSNKDGVLDLGFFRTPSLDLAKNLAGCDRVLVFGATLGISFDRLIARYTAISPVRALLFDALGDERIEALADAFCAEMKKKYEREGCVLRPRYSPGYGDLPLDAQREIFSVLSLSKEIGLSLSESLLMTPRKSVTAFVGIRSNK